MKMKYKAIDKKIVRYDDYDQYDVALCDVPEKAIELMEKAHYLNDVKRKYTASARLFNLVEQLPGFKWF